MYMCVCFGFPGQAPYLAGCCFGRGCGRRRWRLINEWNKYFLVSLLLVKSAAGPQRRTEGTPPKVLTGLRLLYILRGPRAEEIKQFAAPLSSVVLRANAIFVYAYQTNTTLRRCDKMELEFRRLCWGFLTVINSAGGHGRVQEFLQRESQRRRIYFLVACEWMSGWVSEFLSLTI